VVKSGKLFNQVAVFRSYRYRAGSDDWGTAEELDEHYGKLCPRVRAAVAKINRSRRWPMCDRLPIANWTRHHITLLGDAAHPTLQYLAQGAQMAIEDGVVLAEKVAAAGENYNRAFMAYQRERMNRSARVVLSSRFFGEYIHVDGGARALRNELARGRDPDFPWEVDWLYKGIDVNDKL